MEDYTKFTDARLLVELNRANEEYTGCVWRNNSLSWQQEPYKSIKVRLFTIRKELVRRWERRNSLK